MHGASFLCCAISLLCSISCPTGVFILILGKFDLEKIALYSHENEFLKLNHAAIFCTLSFTCEEYDSETNLLKVINILIANFVIISSFVPFLEYSSHVLRLTLPLHKW